jgi:hypothetical protein
MSITEYIEKWGIKVTIVKELRDYSKDPFFIKKKEEAIKFLEEHGVPKELNERQDIPEKFKKRK